jgi:hypothetical protein
MVFVTAGGVAFYCFGQLDGLTKAAQVTPQNLSLADLIENGPGGNANVQLTGFTFGKPVVEERDGRWRGVWLPLEPTARSKKKSGPVVLWAERVANPKELQEFVKQTSLNVLCVARLPEDSRLRVGLTRTFQTANPKTDLGKVTVLAEPTYVLPGGLVLRADVLFDPTIARATAWAGFIGFIVGGFCLWRGCRSPQIRVHRGKVKEGERPTPAPPPEAYERLAQERELSLHPFAWRLVFNRAMHRGGILFFCLLGIGFLIFTAAQAFKTGKVEVIGFSVVLSLLLFYVGLYATFMSVGALFQGISGFAVYPSGIRWQEGKKTRSALWEDIAEVYRTETRLYSARGELRNSVSTMLLRLYDGRVLKMSADTYGDFEILAHNVQSAHGGWIAAVKRQELAEHGQATFGPIALCDDGVVLHGRLYPAEELGKYEIENGSIHFYHPGRIFFSRTTIPLLSVPNSAAMVSLLADLQHVVRGRRKVAV